MKSWSIALALSLPLSVLGIAGAAAEPGRSGRSPPSAPTSGELVVEVSNLRSGGRVLVAVFEDARRFPSFDGSVAASRVAVSGPTARAVFRQLPYGRYAVAVVHDLNGNGRLDTKLGILPAEPIGFSNDAKLGRFGPPSYDAAAIEFVSKRHTVPVTVR